MGVSFAKSLDALGVIKLEPFGVNGGSQIIRIGLGD